MNFTGEKQERILQTFNLILFVIHPSPHSSQLPWYAVFDSVLRWFPTLKCSIAEVRNGSAHTFSKCTKKSLCLCPRPCPFVQLGTHALVRGSEVCSSNFCKVSHTFPHTADRLVFYRQLSLIWWELSSNPFLFFFCHLKRGTRESS